MSSQNAIVDRWISEGYEHGFVTAIDSDTLPPGLNEDTIRTKSARKNNWKK